jgi:hypothetical protein
MALRLLGQHPAQWDANELLLLVSPDLMQIRPAETAQALASLRNLDSAHAAQRHRATELLRMYPHAPAAEHPYRMDGLLSWLTEALGSD